MAGRVGGDALGPAPIEKLARQGADTSHIMTDQDSSTGVVIITVDETGENRIVISAAASGRVNKSDIDAAKGLLLEGKLPILWFEIPLEVVDYAIEKAAPYPARVILNPAPASPVSPAFLRQLDLLVPNETETQTLTGLDVSGLAPAEKAARLFLEYVVPEVTIALGEKGALLTTDEGATHVTAHKVKAADTTAAGDVSIGGLAVASVRGLSRMEAVPYAACASDLAVTKFGAQTSLPSAKEAQALCESVATAG